MRLVQFEKDGSRSVGVQLRKDGDILDLPSADASLPTDMRSFIEGGQQHLLTAKRLMENGEYVVRKDTVRISAPIYNPEKILCVGMNYKDHCEELNTPLPLEPIIFSKFPTCIIGPTDNLNYPEETQMLDWEVELAIVIGREGKRVKESDALDYVFGYTLANDVTARDWMDKSKNGGQVLIAKAMDGFCPLGPAIVTTDEITDPHNLQLSCHVNGVVKQKSNTNQLIHKSAAIVAHISRFITLRPGDLVLTGTPPGVGYARNPPQFLQRGDMVECEIEKIGKLRNKVV